MAKIWDRYENEIEFTDERRNHIITGHPELDDYYEEVLETIKKGRRKQEPMDEKKYKDNLPVVVKLIRNNFILTAYGVER